METRTEAAIAVRLPINPTPGTDHNEDFEAFSDRGLTAPGVFLERSSFRNRSVTNVDLRVMKNFRIGEKSRVQLSFEFFNLPNTDNVVFDRNARTYGRGINPQTGAVEGPNATFLRLRTDDGEHDRVNSQVGSPFQMQVGLRLFF